MKASGTLVLALGACLSIVLAAVVRAEFAASKSRVRDETEMTLFPSGRFLREMSLGHRHLVADLGWLAAIQYYGKHRMTDRRYEMAPHLFSVITEADTAFENAYLFGALVLAEAHLLDDGARMLKEGVARNPESWFLNFELGFYHYIFMRRWEAAAAAFAAAAELPGAPEYARRFAAAAYEKTGDEETARKLWEIIATQSDNQEIRRMAEERLESLADS
ncbi:MAG: hypothetical protein KAY24_03680 [Candidatus Eisenbacteria sp.]|nr:hypothetical protein [Candidatus Eisenbacteria bacterium]